MASTKLLAVDEFPPPSLEVAGDDANGDAEHREEEEQGDAEIEKDLSEQTDEEVKKGPSKHRRLASLDAVRGLNMAIMVLVDEIGGVYPHINHSPWNNITFADLVMPWFLFMVGAALPFSLAKFKRGGKKEKALGTKKVVIRAIKLYLLGVLLQGGGWPDGTGTGDSNYTYGFNLGTIRLCGILNRIAYAYLVSALAELWLPTFKGCGIDAEDRKPICGPTLDPHITVLLRYIWHWLFSVSFVLLYVILTFATFVPTWVSIFGPKDGVNYNTTIDCNVRGHIATPQCSAQGFYDRMIMRQSHLGGWMSKRLPECSSCSPGYCAPFSNHSAIWCDAYMYDPEGLLSTLPTVLSVWLGVHFGRVAKKTMTTRGVMPNHVHRLIHWAIFSCILMASGGLIHWAGYPMNKQLWTPSYLLFEAGACGATLTVFYAIMDVPKSQWPSRILSPLQYMGQNAILLFFFHGTAEAIIDAFYWVEPHNDHANLLHTVIRQRFFCNFITDAAGCQLAYVLTKIFVWFVVCFILAKLNYFWKI